MPEGVNRAGKLSLSMDEKIGEDVSTCPDCCGELRVVGEDVSEILEMITANGYRSKWAADEEAALRSILDTARLAGTQPFHAILRALHF